MSAPFRLLMLVAFLAVSQGCRSAPEADGAAPPSDAPGDAPVDTTSEAPETEPAQKIELTDVETREVVAGVLTNLPRLRDAKSRPVKLTGTTGALPREAAEVTIIPWDDSFVPGAIDLRFLEQEGDTLVTQVYIVNPLGGPSIIDVEFARVDGAWRFQRILGSQEYL